MFDFTCHGFAGLVRRLLNVPVLSSGAAFKPEFRDQQKAARQAEREARDQERERRAQEREREQKERAEARDQRERERATPKSASAISDKAGVA